MKKLIFISLIVALLCACSDEDSQPLEALFTSDTQSIAAGDTVFFKDMSLGNPVRWDWYFEGGTPATSQQFSPEIAYTVPGTYAVKLVVGRGNDSVLIEKSSYITVEYPGEIRVDFTVNKTIATNIETIEFTDKSTGFPNSWLWEFIPDVGQTVTSTEQNPAMTFEPGIYTVKLTATNPKTSATNTRTDMVTIIDVNSVAADFSAVCPYTYGGGTVKFEDKTQGNVKKWNWSFEGGTPATSTDQNPEITYSSPGRYKVTLISSNDEKSSTAVKENYVIVISGQDLVLFYPFEGELKDIGPNGIQPQILSQGAGLIDFSSPSRKDGEKAAQFHSENMSNYAILSLPDNNALDFGSSDFTVTFWSKTSPTSSNQCVYHHGEGPGYNTDGISKQSWLRYQPSNQYMRFVIEYTGSSGNWTEYKDKNMMDGQWHHYIGVHKSGNTYLYIDGELAATSLNKPLKSIGRTPYFIGSNYRVTGGAMQYENFFRGTLDDYILYNRALSETEAKELYNNLK